MGFNLSRSDRHEQSFRGSGNVVPWLGSFSLLHPVGSWLVNVVGRQSIPDEREAPDASQGLFFIKFSLFPPVTETTMPAIIASGWVINRLVACI